MVLMLLSRLTLLVLPVIAALCAVVPAMGGRPLHADEAWDQFGFGACDLPCFAGIMPGKTSFQETPSLLRRNIPVMQNRMFNTGTVVSFWASSQQYDLSGSARHTWGVVDEIRLDTLLPLDHVVAELGMPDCIVPGITSTPSRSTLIFWVRGDVSIGAVVRNNRSVLNLDTRVSVMWMEAADPSICVERGAVRWHGFAPLWEYVWIDPTDTAQSTSLPTGAT